MFTMIYFNEWKLRGCVCIHRQCVDMHRTAINVYLHKMHSCSHPDTDTPRLRVGQRWCCYRHRGGWWTLFMPMWTLKRMPQQVGKQLLTITDSWERHQTWLPLLFFTLWARKGSWLTLLPLDHHPAKSKRHFWSDHSLILGCNSLRFGCFILKCSQVHEMIHQPWLCLVIWLVFWTTKRPDNSLWIIKSGGGNPDTIIVFTESRNLASLKLVVHRGWETAEGDWKRKQWAKIRDALKKDHLAISKQGTQYFSNMSNLPN